MKSEGAEMRKRVHLAVGEGSTGSREFTEI